jgi:hypothetical protein
MFSLAKIIRWLFIGMILGTVGYAILVMVVFAITTVTASPLPEKLVSSRFEPLQADALLGGGRSWPKIDAWAAFVSDARPVPKAPNLVACEDMDAAKAFFLRALADQASETTSTTKLEEVNRARDDLDTQGWECVQSGAGASPNIWFLSLSAQGQYLFREWQ